MRQGLVRGLWIVMAGASVVVASAAWASMHRPDWTIGRAVIIKARRQMSVQPELYLKLSLRNIGTPGRVWVRIYGRWQSLRTKTAWTAGWETTEPTPWSQENRPHQRLPPGMRLLGQYYKEVSLNQTAILEVPLMALGGPRRNASRLEVVVMTATAVTDHRFVTFYGYRTPNL